MDFQLPTFVSPKLLAPLAGFAVLLLVLTTFGKVPIRYNLRNLVVRWPITLLTAAAFTVVVALLIGMLAFVNGMYRLTNNSGQPGNVMVLSDGATDELFSNLGYADSTDVERQRGVLRDDSGRPMCSRETYIVVNQPIPGAAKGQRQRRFTQIRGVDDPVMAGRVHGLPLHPGSAWFSRAGVQILDDSESGKELHVIQAVLGEGIARELGKDRGKPTLVPGDTFQLGPRRWLVVGVMQTSGSTFDSEIWAKRQVVGPMFGKETVYTAVVLRTPDAKAAKALAADLTKNFKKAALQAQTETDYYEKLSETNRQFLFTILIVAVILAIGGIFGVMNTMFAAISARTRDIGVLRILGFARWQILMSFFLESLLLALIGGGLGCAIGSLADGWAASSIVSGGQGGGKSVLLKLVVDANTISAGLLFTLLMGALGGLLPALSAMRLRPLEALR
jgi:ABC-type antimicrobial peptide transport system permease subunit